MCCLRFWWWPTTNNRAESESQKQTSAEAKDGQSHLCGRNVERGAARSTAIPMREIQYVHVEIRMMIKR